MALHLRNETTTQVARMELLDESLREQVENIRDGNARIESAASAYPPARARPPPSLCGEIP